MIPFRFGRTAVAVVVLAVAGCSPSTASQSAGGSASAGSSGTQGPTPSPTVAQTFGTPGTFVPTGSMKVGRDSAAAVLLLDGRVLIVGGEGYEAAKSAELYDPATGKFSLTGAPTVGREVTTATLLKDGRVLIVSGWEYKSETDREESASAELFDPATGKFSATGSLPEARHFATATLLLNGKVLVAGGETPSEGEGTATAELYDPATGKFSPTGSMTKARIFHTATLMKEGGVLVAGGNFDSSAEVYNPATGTFAATGSMTITSWHTATLLGNGKVLVAGDSQDASFVSHPTAELYDPATGKFSLTGAMKNSCNCSGPMGDSVTAPLLPDGRVLVPDSMLDASSNQVGSAELYDPATGTFSQAGFTSRYRYGFTDTLLNDGRVLFAGNVGQMCAMVCPSLSPSAAAAVDADRTSAELFVP